MTNKPKHITVDEIHAIINDELSAEERRKAEHAERTFRRVMAKVNRRKFSVIDRGTICVRLWSMMNPFTPAYELLQQMFREAGFEMRLGSNDYGDDDLIHYAVRLITLDSLPPKEDVPAPPRPKLNALSSPPPSPPEDPSFFIVHKP